jgi:hypothetical protein
LNTIVLILPNKELNTYLSIIFFILKEMKDPHFGPFTSIRIAN